MASTPPPASANRSRSRCSAGENALVGSATTSTPQPAPRASPTRSTRLHVVAVAAQRLGERRVAAVGRRLDVRLAVALAEANGGRVIVGDGQDRRHERRLAAPAAQRRAWLAVGADLGLDQVRLGDDLGAPAGREHDRPLPQVEGADAVLLGRRLGALRARGRDRRPPSRTGRPPDGRSARPARARSRRSCAPARSPASGTRRSSPPPDAADRAGWRWSCPTARRAGRASSRRARSDARRSRSPSPR